MNLYFKKKKAIRVSGCTRICNYICKFSALIVLLAFCGALLAQDSDFDGIDDEFDNCIEVQNGPLFPDSGGNSQLDTDEDGFGNLCDPDFNGNNIIDPGDFSLFKSVFGQTSFPDQDLNGNGIVDPFDFSLLKSKFGQAPGPAGERAGDSFLLLAPVQDQELSLNANENIIVSWVKNGVPQSGETITFSTTRGWIIGGNGDSTATTDSSGMATIQVTSSNAGLATINATNDEATNTNVYVEFVADTPTSLMLRASPNFVETGMNSLVTATIRDAVGNRVKNKTIEFILEQDNSGDSSLSNKLVITNSQGQATTTFTAGSVRSGSGGIIIRATVIDFATVTDTEVLTVY